MYVNVCGVCIWDAIAHKMLLCFGISFEQIFPVINYIILKQSTVCVCVCASAFSLSVHSNGLVVVFVFVCANG